MLDGLLRVSYGLEMVSYPYGYGIVMDVVLKVLVGLRKVLYGLEKVSDCPRKV